MEVRPLKGNGGREGRGASDNRASGKVGFDKIERIAIRDHEEEMMTTLWLDKGAGGWRHKIGDDPVYCGSIIEVRIEGEWVRGRYEAENLDPSAPRPPALLYINNDQPPIRIEEFTEARFPAKR